LLQKDFHPRDPLAGAADVPPLAAIRPARTRQAIIRPKNHAAATFDFQRFAGLQHRPANRTVPDIETEMQIGRHLEDFSLDAHIVFGIIHLSKLESRQS